MQQNTKRNAFKSSYIVQSHKDSWLLLQQHTLGTKSKLLAMCSLLLLFLLLEKLLSRILFSKRMATAVWFIYALTEPLSAKSSVGVFLSPNPQCLKLKLSYRKNIKNIFLGYLF